MGKHHFPFAVPVPKILPYEYGFFSGDAEDVQHSVLLSRGSAPRLFRALGSRVWKTLEAGRISARTLSVRHGLWMTRARSPASSRAMVGHQH